MKRFILAIFILSMVFVNTNFVAQTNSFTMNEIMQYPFPNGLAAASNSNRIAWAVNESGSRNIYVAEAPDYRARKLTNYNNDEGQALTSIQLSSDGNWVIFIRGGDFGSNWGDELSVNPEFKPDPPKVEIWSIQFNGGTPKLIGEGIEPVVSPQNDKIAFVKKGQIFTSNISGESEPIKLFTTRGKNNSIQWSPDGSMIAFRSNRNDHSFIGVYNFNNSSIFWLSPSFDRDSSPRWSPDGKNVAFIRQNGRGGMPDSILAARNNPWKIITIPINGEEAKVVWEAPKTIRGSIPSTHGRTNLHYAADGKIVFLSYHDGWPHLYSIDESGRNLKLLTPGNYMAEYISISPDKKAILFAGNTGPDKFDIDRRHIVRTSIYGGDLKVITPGNGNEWTPQVLKNKDIVYISATAQRPPLPAILKYSENKQMLIGENLIPKNYPTSNLVIPTQVVFNSADGTKIHATLFKPKKLNGKAPAIVFLHGGPPRQMLLGWHYSSYYSNAYSVNQYLASKGFVVLSVNYRLGIGYGYEFHKPVDGGTRGASEYQDVKAGGEWLAKQNYVNKNKIGLYGGSYGGYLTAMALGRNSDLFKAGVDISGVHDRTVGRVQSYLMPRRFDRALDAERALETAWRSSPIADVNTWESPVLIIHADDDRNVNFEQSTDLVQRLRELGVPLETLVIVDDTHHFILFKNQLKVNEATVEFFERRLK